MVSFNTNVHNSSYTKKRFEKLIKIKGCYSRNFSLKITYLAAALQFIKTHKHNYDWVKWNNSSNFSAKPEFLVTFRLRIFKRTSHACIHSINFNHLPNKTVLNIPFFSKTFPTFFVILIQTAKYLFLF